MEISEKGYTSKIILVMGNTVFNLTVHYKSSDEQSQTGYEQGILDLY